MLVIEIGSYVSSGWSYTSHVGDFELILLPLLLNAAVLGIDNHTELRFYNVLYI